MGKALKAKGKGMGNANGTYGVFGGVIVFQRGGQVSFMHKEKGLGERMDFDMVLNQVSQLQEDPTTKVDPIPEIEGAAAAILKTISKKEAAVAEFLYVTIAGWPTCPWFQKAVAAATSTP